MKAIVRNFHNLFDSINTHISKVYKGGSILKMKHPSSSIVISVAAVFSTTVNTNRCSAWILPTKQHRKLSDSNGQSLQWINFNHFLKQTTSSTCSASTNQRYSNQHKQLFMTAAAHVDKTIPVESTTTDSNSSNKMCKEETKKITEGTILVQYPCGFAAVRINDETTVLLDPASINNNPMVVGVEAAVPSTKGIGKVKLTSMDFQGKRVVYPNGASGVVIAHRPPLIFCYSIEDNTMTNIDDENNNNNNNITSNIVQVMDDMVKISISPNDRRFDCFGKSHLSTTVVDPQDTNNNNKRFLSDRMIFGPIPKVSDIALINYPMITGNTMIDTLAPIGRGQNMLLIGSNIDNMRSIARDFLKTQVETSVTSSSSLPTICVYASTEMDQTLAYQRIKDSGIDGRIHYVGTTKTRILDANNNDKSDVSYFAESVMVVNTAIAIAESYALYENRHTVVVIDTIDLYKSLHDVTTRILVDTFGIQSVVQQDPNSGGTSSSEMRSFYSAFIQRAGQYNAKMGGGSITLLLLTTIPPTDVPNATDLDQLFTIKDFEQCSEAIKNRIKILDGKGIPLTAATLKKINIPLPTITEYDRRLQLQHIDELISMSDGQIWLDDTIGMKNMKPLIDPQRSITRIGVGADTQSRADAPAIRRIAEGIRLELIQSSISSMSGTVDISSTATQKQLRRQRSLLYAMYQPPGMVPIRRLSESCIVLLAARQGYLDPYVDDDTENGTNIPSSGEYSIVRKLLQYIQEQCSDDIKTILNEIDTTQDITDLSKMKLLETISEFFAQARKS